MRFVKSICALVVVSLCVVPALVMAGEQQKPKQSAEVKAYMDYRKEVPKAKRLEDLYFHFDAKSIEYYRSMNTAERATILQQLKAQVTTFPELVLVNEAREIGVAHVTFNAKSTDNKEAQVTVEIIREGAALKIGQASWKAGA